MIYTKQNKNGTGESLWTVCLAPWKSKYIMLLIHYARHGIDNKHTTVMHNHEIRHIHWITVLFKGAEQTVNKINASINTIYNLYLRGNVLRRFAKEKMNLFG